MAARDLEVEVDISKMCLRCTVDTKCDQYIFSSQFRFGGVGWKLRYFKMGTNYNLFLLKGSGVPPQPLRVSAHVEGSEDGRIVNVLPHVTRFTTQSEEEDVRYVRHFVTVEFQRSGTHYPIWWEREDEILQSVPEFRVNGILKLIVVLIPEGEECPCATCQFTATDNNDPSLESFLKDLGNLLDQDASTDVEFRCADADGNILTTVRAHKLLVCARSPVLAAMLHSDMVEGRTGVATVRDIDASVFKQFLKYLYSGKLDETMVNMDTAMSLYQAGDRFQVKSLTKHCAKWMVRNLTTEKSCEVLVLADAHRDEELAEATVTFMVNRVVAPVAQVFNGWKDFCRKHPSPATRFKKRFYKLVEEMCTEGEYCCSRQRRIV